MELNISDQIAILRQRNIKPEWFIDVCLEGGLEPESRLAASVHTECTHLDEALAIRDRTAASDVGFGVIWMVNEDLDSSACSKLGSIVDLMSKQHGFSQDHSIAYLVHMYIIAIGMFAIGEHSKVLKLSTFWAEFFSRVGLVEGRTVTVWGRPFTKVASVLQFWDMLISRIARDLSTLETDPPMQWAHFTIPPRLVVSRTNLCASRQPQDISNALISERTSQPCLPQRESEIVEANCVSASFQAFFQQGDHWVISFRSTMTLVKDMKGMKYIWKLLGSPCCEIHVEDLEAPSDSVQAVGVSGRLTGADDTRLEPLSFSSHKSQPGLEKITKSGLRELKSRMAGMEHVIAAGLPDPVEHLKMKDTLKELKVYLRSTVDIHGRPRKTHDGLSRARLRVRRALYRAISRIRVHHPGFAQHLEVSIRGGYSPSYVPDRNIEWDLG